MQFNPQEISALAQAEAAAPRMDMYAFIHKALRAFMTDTLTGLGRMDADDDLELSQTGARVLQLLDFCRSHLHHENAFVHPAMERHAPGSAATVAREHEGHEQAIAALAAGAVQLMHCPRERRARVAHALYQQLALFVAHNFEHMHQEETGHNAVLWAHYSDAELAALEGALVASIPPDEMMVTLRWMLPYMTPAERAMMLGEMRRNAPPQAFEAALGVVRPQLSPAEWGKLARALGLAQ
ncbi:hypothetical protein [Alicycliphilus denitrificans]|uniref:hemerythrin domain-containing protein n=1 Tax=Alicycliphilus denitrificans TaxID=179636 RepID=UPI00384E3AB6